jgi:3-methylcrotonyl-CoA carboxylase beta subunit
MLMTLASLEVPKFTVVVGGGFGAGYYAMCGRPFKPRLLFAWPNAQVAIMGAEQAASTLLQVKLASARRDGRELAPEEIAQLRAQMAREFGERNDAYHNTSELKDDGVLVPPDTRQALAVAISASLNRPFEGGTAFGIMRM